MKMPCLLIVLTVLAGCKSAPPPLAVEKNTPSIYLREAITMTIKDGVQSTVQFPAGEYVPDFRIRAGIYYRAPSRIVFTIRADQTPKEAASGAPKPSVTKLANGGVFLSLDRQTHGAWADVEGMIEGTSSFIQKPTHMMPLTERVPYSTTR